MKPNWKDAPKWAKWLAMDNNGSWWWYSKKPKWNYIAGIWDAPEDDMDYEEAYSTECGVNTLEPRRYAGVSS